MFTKMHLKVPSVKWRSQCVNAITLAYGEGMSFYRFSFGWPYVGSAIQLKHISTDYDALLL